MQKLDAIFQTHFQLQKIFIFKKLECRARESQVRENFAVQLRAINQKKSLLAILTQNVQNAQLRFKLV